MKSIGYLKPFYKNAAVLSEYVSIGGLEPGGELSSVPEYMLSGEIDFPYQKKAEKEILFTDHVSWVRFLGGISDGRIPCDEEKEGKLDLAYRCEDGSIKIRRHLIERYRPFVDLYKTEITVVLDNIPRVFSKKDYIDDYGNITPPNDYNDWRSFIKNMCKELIKCYGYETVNCWRFRIATEGRLDAETIDFCKHYDITTAAIREVLPDTKFAPYNIAAITNIHHHKNNMYAIARHCAQGTNIDTGEIGTPIDFLPVSYYSIPIIDKNNKILPETICPVTRSKTEYYNYWDNIGDFSEEFKKIPREIQELGILTNEYGRHTSEPGARGAAWLFQLLFTMLESNAISRIWHWHTTDVIAVHGKGRDDYKRVLRSNGWLYSILDHMVGSDMYVMDSAFATPCDQTVTLKAVGFLGVKKYVVLSAFNINRSMIYDSFVYIDIPWEFCKVKKDSIMNFTSLSNDSDVYQVIYRDLKSENLLNTNIPASIKLTKEEKYYNESFYNENIPNIPGVSFPVCGLTKGCMASDEGMVFIENNWEKYENMIKDSLKLKPMNAMVYEKNGYSRIYIKIKTPETVVIKL